MRYTSITALLSEVNWSLIRDSMDYLFPSSLQVTITCALFYSIGEERFTTAESSVVQ